MLTPSGSFASPGLSCGACTPEQPEDLVAYSAIGVSPIGAGDAPWVFDHTDASSYTAIAVRAYFREKAIIKSGYRAEDLIDGKTGDRLCVCSP
ncbi:MAG TPA: hypothetical protein VFP68_07165 [Burkholderiaceae bacterium]|nr:hypothetical protein [Burkholderiaceae bacterium]